MSQLTGLSTQDLKGIRPHNSALCKRWNLTCELQCCNSSSRLPTLQHKSHHSSVLRNRLLTRICHTRDGAFIQQAIRSQIAWADVNSLFTSQGKNHIFILKLPEIHSRLSISATITVVVITFINSSSDNPKTYYGSPIRVCSYSAGQEKCFFFLQLKVHHPGIVSTIITVIIPYSWDFLEKQEII